MQINKQPLTSSIRTTIKKQQTSCEHRLISMNLEW